MVFIFHKIQANRKNVMSDDSFSLCMILLSFSCFPSLLIIWIAKIQYKKLNIAFYFQIFSTQKLCHDYHVDLCHNLHEPFGLPQGVLTLDYVAHASMTRFSLSIDVYCSTCVSVLWNKTNVTQCTHSNFVKCAYHLCL